MHQVDKIDGYTPQYKSSTLVKTKSPHMFVDICSLSFKYTVIHIDGQSIRVRQEVEGRQQKKGKPAKPFQDVYDARMHAIQSMKYLNIGSKCKKKK